MLTSEEIAELWELLEKATPGDWEVQYGLNVRNTAGEAVCSGGMQRGDQPDSGNAENHANACLIATMKTRLPALLAELKAAREVVADMEEIADTDPDEGTQWFHDIALASLSAYEEATK